MGLLKQVKRIEDFDGVGDDFIDDVSYIYLGIARGRN